mgnify:CR=1 FL=1
MTGAGGIGRGGLPLAEVGDGFGRIDERALGALMMHFMLETILTGYALGVDPFDQPAVEEGKILAKQYLAQG